MKPARVILSPAAQEVYRHLNEEAPKSKTERTILNAINNKVELIKANPHYGNPVSKNLIPKEYVITYGVTNLFRVGLPNFWRMLYSMVDGESKIEIVAFVLDVIGHKQYNKKFGYRKN